MRKCFFIVLLALSLAPTSRAERHSGNGQAFNPFQSRGNQQNGNNNNNNNGNNSNNSNNNNNSGSGSGSSGGGSASVQYKPRQQDKINDGALKGAEPFQKKEEESLKNYSTEVGKLSENLNKQMEKAVIAESDALIKEIAKESNDVAPMTGIGKDSVAGLIGDSKNLGDSAAKGYLVQAQAVLNAQKQVPAPTPVPLSVGEEIAQLTGRPHGGSLGSSFGTASSGKTSSLQPIRAPAAQLGGGEHSTSGLETATAFNRGAIYNAPAAFSRRK